MARNLDYLDLDDAALLRECDVHVYKSSGPGGQHRNKVSSAVRLRHRPTGLTVHGDQSRSQHTNKRLALQRLRMNIACRLRSPMAPGDFEIPAAVAECLVRPRDARADAPARLQVGPKNKRFCHVAAVALDLLEARAGRLAEAAASLGVTTSNFAAVLKAQPHVFAAAQAIRKAHGRTSLK